MCFTDEESCTILASILSHEEWGYIIVISTIQIIMIVLKMIDKDEFHHISWWFIFIPVFFSIFTGMLIKIMYCVFIPKNEKNNDSITSIDTELAHHDINPYQHLKTVEVRSQEEEGKSDSWV